MNKHVNRRNFLKLSATAGAALALTPAGVANFTSIGFMQQKKDPEITEKGFFYESNNVLLPRLADKGLRGEDIRNRLPNHQFPRPRPVAEFIASGTVGKPSQFFKPIAVELLEEAGVARDAAVRFGLPFPDKSLYSTETLEVRNSSGEKIPAQFSVTEFWPDRSVRWCLIQFVAPLKPKEKAVYTVQYFQENGKPESSVTVKEDAEKIIVDTGKINVEIDKIRFNIFRRVSCNNRSVGSFATGGVVGYAEDGREFSLTAIKPRRIAFEERGSETVVVRIDGSYGYSDGSPSFLDYTVRLRFIRNSASVQIDITTIKAGLEYEFSDFKELRLTFLPNGNISGVSGNVYAATLAPYENRAGVEQKSVKPAIEDVAGNFLNAKRTADILNLAEFIKSKKIGVHWTSGNSWALIYKSKRLGYIKIYYLDIQEDGTYERLFGKPHPLSKSWLFCHNRNYLERYYEMEDSGLKTFIYDNLYAKNCGRCFCTWHGKEKAELDERKTGYMSPAGCGCWPLRVYNPAGETLELTKRLVEFRMDCISDDIKK